MNISVDSARKWSEHKIIEAHASDMMSYRASKEVLFTLVILTSEARRFFFSFLAETDEESLDTSDEVSTTPVQSTKPCSESDSAVDAMPQPASVLVRLWRYLVLCTSFTLMGRWVGCIFTWDKKSALQSFS